MNLSSNSSERFAMFSLLHINCQTFGFVEISILMLWRHISCMEYIRQMAYTRNLKLRNNNLLRLIHYNVQFLHSCKTGTATSACAKLALSHSAFTCRSFFGTGADTMPVPRGAGISLTSTDPQRPVTLHGTVWGRPIYTR